MSLLYAGWLCTAVLSGTSVAEVSKCYRVTFSDDDDQYCFYISGSVMRWHEATQFCAARNSSLPHITDENIDSVFQQFIANDSSDVTQNRHVWIAAHARPLSRNDTWHWINRQPSGSVDAVTSCSPLLCRFTVRRYS